MKVYDNIGYLYIPRKKLDNMITPSNYVMEFMVNCHQATQHKKEQAIEMSIIEFVSNYIEVSVKQCGYQPNKALKVFFDRNILELECPENGKSKFMEKDGKWSFTTTLPEIRLRQRNKYERKQLALYILIKNKLNNNTK